MGKEVDQFEAAKIVGMSPTLLNWLTKNAPKSGEESKLKLSRKEGKLRFFDTDELKSFNAWLKKPWPLTAKGKRPHVPSGIREEIKTEAYGKCAMCQQNPLACEAAHIIPVSDSKSNHPENLLWLCSNHHTENDKLFQLKQKKDYSEAKKYKDILHLQRSILWQVQAESTTALYSVLSQCRLLDKELQSSQNDHQKVKVVENIATEFLGKLPDIFSDAANGITGEAEKKIKSLTSSFKSAKTTSKKLKAAVTLRAEYATAHGYIACPLCKGTSEYEGFICPFCQGDGQVDSKLKDADLSEFEMVNCPVCDGKGELDHNLCPVCRGDQQMMKRQADGVDTKDFETVDCPICKGAGERGGAKCQACNGEGSMFRIQLADLRESDFEEINCPRCGGAGYVDDRKCTFCGGEQTVTRLHAQEFNPKDYALTSCPVCKGKGHRIGRDCSFCGGERKVSKDSIENADLSVHELVKCPACKGRGHMDGEDCGMCEGWKKVEQFRADEWHSNN